MAEILIQIVDKVDNTHTLRAFNYSAGDVIDIQQDQWPWTQKELTNPSWRVVRLNNVAVSSLVDMCSTKKDVLGHMVGKREKTLDMTKVETLLKAIPLGSVFVASGRNRTDLLDARIVKPSAQVVIG